MLADPTVPEIDIAIAVKALVVVAAMLLVIALILKFWIRRISLPCQFRRARGPSTVRYARVRIQ